MPGRVFVTSPIEEIADALGVSSTSVADEPVRRNIAPGEQVVALTSLGLSRFRWGMIPVGRTNARGRPVMETIINARSETVFDKSAFDGVGRAVLPVNGWYEWTGEKRRKIAWEITSGTGDLLYFAAITDVWTAPGGVDVPQLATVTCAPNADVEPIHHRMAVILDRSDIPVWLNGDPAEAKSLMQPYPEGKLHIEQADGSYFT